MTPATRERAREARETFERATLARNPSLAYVDCSCGARIPGHVTRCPVCRSSWQGRSAAQQASNGRIASLLWRAALWVGLAGIAWACVAGWLS